jgi:3-isopropylmalate/(R)-2-methylmalate dehydratase small subunit
MEPFTVVRGPAATLMLPDVNTDVLAPAHSGRSELAAAAFAPLRYLPDGSDNPDFVLNDPRFRGAPILLAGRNFGCGSSREVAVWALAALGIRCVVASSFGDIFAGNAVQNGLLPIVLDAATITALAAEAEGGEPFEVDLHERVVRAPSGRAISFAVNEMRRTQLLEGLDDLGLTLRRLDEITAFQTADRIRRPWVHDIPDADHADKHGARR